MNTTDNKLSRAKAEATLEAIKRSHGWTPETDAEWSKTYGKPTLVEDWEWGWNTTHFYPWAILWEEGPYEWAHRIGGGFDEEMYHLAREFGEEVARRLATRGGADLPEGVWTEAITGWAAAVYPKEAL